MKSDVSYWCAVGVVKQQAVREDGAIYEVDKDHPVGEQHILYQGVLMCGASRDTLKNKLHAKRVRNVKLRIENVPLCKKCEAKYKANSNLAWVKWVSATQANQELHGVKSIS